MIRGLDAPRLRVVLRDVLARRAARPARVAGDRARGRAEAAAQRRRAAERPPTRALRRGGLAARGRCRPRLRCCSRWLIALVLWGVAHGSSSIERGFDIPIVIRRICPTTSWSSDQSARRGEHPRAREPRRAARHRSRQTRVPRRRVGRAAAATRCSRSISRRSRRCPRGARIVSRSPAESRGQVRAARPQVGEGAADLDGRAGAGLRAGRGRGGSAPRLARGRPARSAPAVRGADRNDRRQRARRAARSARSGSRWARATSGWRRADRSR